MKNSYKNLKEGFVSERVVEIDFLIEVYNKYFSEGKSVLDIGGIPSRDYENQSLIDTIKNSGAEYYVSDFRGGDFKGDFVSYNFGNRKFDIEIFLSSLEHFSQCTEGDMKFRDHEDYNGFQKALSILNDDGVIFLTIPYGIDKWYNYHQSYDSKTILELTKGSKIIEEFIYVYDGSEWVLKTSKEINEMEIDNGVVTSVGCFVCSK